MDNKTTIHMLQEPRKTELVNACYPIIEAIFEVYKTLGPGLPEYIYEEALLTKKGPQRKPNEVFTMGRAGSSEYFLPKRNFGTSPKVQLERFHNNHGQIEVF